jgi:A/G-specific adenine glycosylase
MTNTLLAWYEAHGRKQLPWRRVRDPYFNLVAEFMAQQTQIDRVVPKFEAFVGRFPTIRVLAAAGAGEVQRMWQGLGYNSRAIRLHETARIVVERYDGVIPSDVDTLRTLPGVGPYTAAALRAFGYDLDDAPIDVNVRRITHRVRFGMEFPARATTVELDREARAMAPAGRAHDWNSALMDLGTAICTARAPKCLICPLRQECAAAPIDGAVLEAARRAHVKKPSPQESLPFERTTRFARGRIIDRLRALAPGERISLLDLHGELAPLLPDRSLEEVRGLVTTLERDGLIAVQDELLALRE